MSESECCGGMGCPMCQCPGCDCRGYCMCIVHEEPGRLLSSSPVKKDPMYLSNIKDRITTEDVKDALADQSGGLLYKLLDKIADEIDRLNDEIKELKAKAPSG